MISVGFERVSKKRPRRICGKPTYCGSSRDEGTSICMRNRSRTQKVWVYLPPLIPLSDPIGPGECATYMSDEFRFQKTLSDCPAVEAQGLHFLLISLGRVKICLWSVVCLPRVLRLSKGYL